MSNTPPRRTPNKTARVAVTVALFNAVLYPFLSPLVRGNMRRADADMQEIRRLLDEYQAIIPPDDQETILVNLKQLRAIKQRLRTQRFSPSDHLDETKRYKVMARFTLEITKEASERAHDDDMVGKMARDTGLTSFITDHPLPTLRRVQSTTSDWSDCTLPMETINVDICQSQETGENALAISVNGGDMPMQQFLTLPSSVSNDHLSTSTLTDEADNSSLPGSPGSTLVEVWDTRSNVS